MESDSPRGVCVMKEIQANYYFAGGTDQPIGASYAGGYVPGTAAPAEVIFDHEIERQRRRREQAEREKKEQRKRELKNSRALKQTRSTAFFVIVGVVLFGGFFTGYVNLQTSIRAHMANISSLKSDISDMKASNSAAQSRIATATDLNDIKLYALTNCQMVYANNGQIVYYDIADEDYMSQYEDIR